LVVPVAAERRDSDGIERGDESETKSFESRSKIGPLARLQSRGQFGRSITEW
jgi:hypothetical protein